MKNIKKALFITAILAILLAPSLSSATTIAEIQAQLNAILQKVQQLQEQLNQYGLGIIYTTPTPTPTPTNLPSCTSVWDCNNGNTACIGGKCMPDCYHGYTYDSLGTRYCADKCYPPNLGCLSGQQCSSSINGCVAGSTLSPSCTISFTPSSIGPGQLTTVRWSSQNDADNLLDYNCTKTNTGSIIGSGQGAIGASGSLTYLYNDISQYLPATCTLTAKNSQNQTSICSANISKTSTEPEGIITVTPWPPSKPYMFLTTQTLGLSGPGAIDARSVKFDPDRVYAFLKVGQTLYFKFTVPEQTYGIEVSVGLVCADSGLTGIMPDCPYYPKDIAIKRDSVPNTAEDRMFLDKDFQLRKTNCIPGGRDGYMINNSKGVILLKDLATMNDFFVNTFRNSIANCSASDLNSPWTGHPKEDVWYNAETNWEITTIRIDDKQGLKPGTYYMAVSFPKRTADLVYQRIIEVAQNTVANLRNRIAQETNQETITELQGY
ncbi:MAG: hypothetical protein KJ977_02005, partial [Candidatus Omnitrophica bacterium]|nr:hypothetical protein [Candidatus Omnitrophota bacterium]